MAGITSALELIGCVGQDGWGTGDPCGSVLRVPSVWEQSKALVLVQDKGQWAQTEAQEVPSEHEEELLYFKDDGALEQAAQRSCEVSFSSPPGRDPVQPAVVGPALAGGLD